ncbi:MAG: tetratricopeptide repeat protein [Kiritimatiellia bacterium]
MPVFPQTEDPFSPKVSRAEAEILREVQSMEDRGESLERLELSVSADSSAALDFSLGNLYYQAEKYKEAQSAYEIALEKFPAFRDARINLGRVYVLLDAPAESVRVFQELARDGIADADTYLLLGHGLMMMNRMVSAETAFRQALLLKEDGVEALRGLLNCLVSQQRNEEVLSLTSELLAEDPAQRSYWAARANAQLSLGKNAEAAESLEQARRLGVADGEMLAMLGQLYLEAAPAEAVERLRESFAKGGGNRSQQEQAVRGLMQLGRLTEADELIDLIRSEIKSLPEPERAAEEGRLLNLSLRLAVLQKRYEEAEELLEVAVLANPLDGELLMLQAQVMQERGREEGALTVLERAARISGFEAVALLKMAEIRAGREEWSLAGKLLERAMVFEQRPELERYLRQLRRMEGRGQ